MKIILCALTAGLVLGAVIGGPQARADVFDICPDGSEGVVGGHTTCDFAVNVQRAFYACGMCHNFPAFSPVTGQRYDMACDGLYPADFSDGERLKSVRCYAGGTDAEVVVW